MATPRDDAHLVETPSNTFYPPDQDYRNNLMLTRWDRESKGAGPGRIGTFARIGIAVPGERRTLAVPGHGLPAGVPG